MKYVKLTAKPGTWFKEGTEVYDYDAPYSDKKLITLEYWDTCRRDGAGGICVRGIRICKYDYEIGLGYEPGEEREDGEYCLFDEFIVEIIDINEASTQTV